MDKEHLIKNTKKYAILKVMFFNGYSVGMQSFVLLSLAIYLEFTHLKTPFCTLEEGAE